MVLVARFGVARAVEARLQGHGAGHAAQGQIAGEGGGLHGAGDRFRAEGDLGEARGVEHLWPLHRLRGEKEPGPRARGVKRHLHPALAEIAQVDPHLGGFDRHRAAIVALREVIGELHARPHGIEAPGLGRGGDGRRDQAESEGKAAEHA